MQQEGGALKGFSFPKALLLFFSSSLCFFWLGWGREERKGPKSLLPHIAAEWPWWKFSSNTSTSLLFRILSGFPSCLTWTSPSSPWPTGPWWSGPNHLWPPLPPASLPSGSLCSSPVGLPALPQTCQGPSCFHDFAMASPSSWNTLPTDIHTINSFPVQVFVWCHLLRRSSPGPSF